MYPFDDPDVGFVMPEFHPVDRDPSFVDVDFVCNGDEYADKAASVAIVSTCMHCSRKCHVTLAVMDVSEEARDRLRERFGRLCPGHVLDIVDPPPEIAGFVRTTSVYSRYGVACLKLYLTDFVDHYNDLFVYNDCDTCTVGDVSSVVDLCRIHGLGDRYAIAMCRDLNCYRSDNSRFMSGFFVASHSMLRAGGYTRSVANLSVAYSPLMQDMYYAWQPACIAGRLMEITPAWCFVRFFLPPFGVDMNEFYGRKFPCVGFERFDPGDPAGFARCYHYSGSGKPWMDRTNAAATDAMHDEWRKVHELIG